MTPQAYKTIIQNKYHEITKQEIQLSDEQFKCFSDTARTFGSGKTILDMWEKFLNDGSTDIQEFFEYCVDVYLGLGDDVCKQ